MGDERRACVSRRAAIGIAHGTAIAATLASLDDLMSAAMSLRVALADGTNDPHLHRDDFAGLGSPTILIDMTRYSLANLTFAGESSLLWVETQDGEPHFIAQPRGSFRNGNTLISSANLTATLTGCATDGEQDLDIIIDLRFHDVKVGRLEEGQVVTNPRLNLGLFFDSNDEPIFNLQAYFDGTRPYKAIIGSMCDVRVRFVRHGTTDVVPGRFVYYIEDIDQPDKFQSQYGGPYTESVTPMAGMSTEIHMRSGTDGYLQWLNNGVYATRSTSGNEDMSAFATMCDADFSYSWHGSDCGSSQLTPFPTSWIKVTKETVGQFAEADRSFSFSVSVNDRPDPVTFSLKNGESHTIDGVSPDAYYEVTETSVDGYETTWTNRSGNVPANTMVKVTARNRRKEAKVTLTKSSDWPELVSGHALYSLAGARFALTDESGRVWATPTSQANGSVATVQVPTGHTYTMAETTASPGHRIPNPASRSVTIPINDESERTLSLQNPTIWHTLDRLANKVDANSRQQSGQGDATDWSAMRVEMQYYQNHDCSGSPSVTTVWAADRDGNVAFATATPTSGTWPWRRGGQNVLPLGSYRVREVTAPVGYRIDGTWRKRNVTESGITDL